MKVIGMASLTVLRLMTASVFERLQDSSSFQTRTCCAANCDFGFMANSARPTCGRGVGGDTSL